MKRPLRLLVVGVVSLALAGGGVGAERGWGWTGKRSPVTAAGGSVAPPLGGLIWPMFGRNRGRTFHGKTLLTPQTAPTLQQRWFVAANGLPVTATPIVANGTVYVGSWDGKFRAIALKTGKLRWTFTVKAQPAVQPDPNAGGGPQNATSDGGIITSSAIFVRQTRSHPPLVIFGGGYTLYALRAGTGHVFWEHDYTGNPAKPPNPKDDRTRIFTSPAVVGNRVLFGNTNDGQNGYHSYLASASLRTGKLQWRFQTDRDAHGKIVNNGCDGVWSSPAVDMKDRLVFFDTADCDGTDSMPLAEKVAAVHLDTGKRAWVFTPPRKDPGCDWDFGATANFRPATAKRPAFLGVGGKDGTYYSLVPTTGKLLWHTNVVFGGSAGGFIGTAALAGNRVFGATAIGDFPGQPCQPQNPNDQEMQEPSMHAFDAKTGSKAWEQEGAQAVSATTVAGHMTFACTAFSQQLQIRNVADGTPVVTIPLSAGCNSGVVVAGNFVIVGEGEAENSDSAGVEMFTPNAEPPKR